MLRLFLFSVSKLRSGFFSISFFSLLWDRGERRSFFGFDGHSHGIFGDLSDTGEILLSLEGLFDHFLGELSLDEGSSIISSILTFHVVEMSFDLIHDLIFIFFNGSGDG